MAWLREFELKWSHTLIFLESNGVQSSIKAPPEWSLDNSVLNFQRISSSKIHVLLSFHILSNFSSNLVAQEGFLSLGTKSKIYTLVDRTWSFLNLRTPASMYSLATPLHQFPKHVPKSQQSISKNSQIASTCCHICCIFHSVFRIHMKRMRKCERQKLIKIDNFDVQRRRKKIKLVKVQSTSTIIKLNINVSNFKVDCSME